MKLKFKRKQVKANELGRVNFLGRPVVKRSPPKIKHSVSLLSPSMKRPAARFYGDYDGDGVMNGLDCEPRNPKKQGPQHGAKRYPYKEKTPEELKILNQFSESVNRGIKEGKMTVAEATEARDSFVGGIRDKEEWAENEVAKGNTDLWEDWMDPKLKPKKFKKTKK